MSVLVVAEQFQGQLKKTTLNALGFGKLAAEKSGGPLYVLVLAESGKGSELAESLANYGAEKVFFAEGEHFKDYHTEAYTQAVVELAKNLDVKMIAAAATVQGKDLLPRVAARLNIAMVPDIIEILDDLTFKRPVWAGAAIAHVKPETDKFAVTIRATSFSAPETSDSKSAVESFSPNLTEEPIKKVEILSIETVKSERPELTEADIVVSGGRGVKDETGVKLIEELADLLNAAVGASRAACDAGLFPNDLQVGQTGKVVAPQLYFAIGISGAIQHLAGMKSSKVIVAINKDPEAPIFQVADYGIVGDLFKVVPELIEKLKAEK